MLELNEITKSYSMGAADAVQALKGINIKFRRCDLVSILGPSGCGKSTTLNIIGGLDQYTTGDLVINGRSTKGFKDRDWDNYRNHSVGFIFQSYNLIRHQSVLDNVELALTLSGVSKKDRREKAKKALIDVGLGDHINKTPKEMSGGQMQRVAIARALVNDPDIILADEPTGALDSKTSVQVMEILKQVAKDRLVVMVTHNPELAEQYSTRIIRMKDGEVVEDTRPLSQKEIQAEKERDIQELKAMNIAIAQENKEDVDHTTPRFKIFKNLNNTKLKTPKELIERAKVKRTQPHLSHKDQFKLSLKNLFTKKGRTILTAFAGSVGIFGIGAVLAISQGMNGYIRETEEKTLSTTPLTISSSATDYTALIQSATELLQNSSGEIVDPERAKDPQVWRKNVIGSVAKLLEGVMQGDNNLGGFKEYIDDQITKPGTKLNEAAAGVFYNYNLKLSTLYEDPDTGEVREANLMNNIIDLVTNHLDFDSELFKNIDITAITPLLSTLSSLSGGSSMLSLDIWQELLTDKFDSTKLNPMIDNQYEIVGEGHWPTKPEEIVVVCDANFEIPDVTLYSLGLIPEDEMACLMNDAINNTHNWEKDFPDSKKNWSLKALKENTKYKMVPNCYFYSRVGEIWTDNRNTPGALETLYRSDKPIELEISAIVKLKDKFASSGGLISGAIGYTKALRDKVVEICKNSDVYKAQELSTNVDILTGERFRSAVSGKGMTTEDKAKEFVEIINGLKPDNDGKSTTDPLDSITVQSRADIYRHYLTTKAEEGLDDGGVKAALQSLIDIYMKDSLIGKLLEKIIEDLDIKDEDIADKLLVIALLTQGYDVASAENYILELKNNPDQYKKLLKTVTSKVIETMIEKYDVVDNVTRSQEFYSYFTGNDGEGHDGAYKEALKITDVDARNAILANWYDKLITFSSNTYDDNLVALGGINEKRPASIKIYANSFSDKSKITSAIDDYNSFQQEEAAKIKYTDYVGFIMSSVGKILDIITYVLIAFAAISLVVSSIMIAVITLISVQERTKEIGILRAIGASKSNVSGMFRAETVMIGLMSGILGVAFSYIICLPMNIILRNVTGAATFTAILTPWWAIGLIAISVALTVLSGLIPSSTAAKKDPVEALRSE
ncbi:MAG: ABC transporter ATP-binding protein/permease [Bacilli bacterium]|nr:ABC transporter ATP-binding protein/permease [Bacilli bacterium]